MSAGVDDPDLTVADELIESADIDGESAGESAGGAPVIRIVRGKPTDADVAALVAVLSAAQSSSSVTEDSRPPELWGTPSSMHRTFAPFSPYSYQASGRY